MKIAASITIDLLEFAERRPHDPWGFASEHLSRKLLAEIQQAFPGGYHIARFHAEMPTPDAFIDEIVVRLEVAAGSEQFDLPTFQSGICELLIGAFKVPAEQGT